MKKYILLFLPLLLCISESSNAQTYLSNEKISITSSSFNAEIDSRIILDGELNDEILTTNNDRPGWILAEFDKPYHVYNIKINKPEQESDLLVVGGINRITLKQPELLMNCPWYDYYHLEQNSAEEVILPTNSTYKQVLFYGLMSELQLYEISFLVDDEVLPPKKLNDPCASKEAGIGYLLETYNNDGQITIAFGAANEVSINGGKEWQSIAANQQKFSFYLSDEQADVFVRSQDGCEMRLVVKQKRVVQQRSTNCSTSSLTPLGNTVHNAITTTTAQSKSTVAAPFVFTCNNRLDEVMVDGPEIFSEVTDMISNAEHEVLISFFVWEGNCEPTDAIRDGFIASQNINTASDPLLVRIVVDVPDAFLIPGIPIGKLTEIFDEINSWGLDMNRFDFQLAAFERTALGNLHDKYIVVDENVVFITGANPQDKHNSNFFVSGCQLLPGNGLTGPWRDSGYRLTGCVGSSAFSAFDFTWNVDACHQYNPPFRFIIDRTTHPTPPRNWTPGHVNTTYGSLNILAATKTRRTSITSNDNQSPQDQAWLAMIDNATENINIVTPNINDDHFRAAILGAIGRGVKVNLVIGRLFNANSTNSPFQGGYNKEVIWDLRNKIREDHPNHIDKFEVRWYSRDSRMQVLNNGGRATHAKYISVDGQLAMVGSGNHDTQAWNFSQEFNLVLDGPTATAELEEDFFYRTWNTSNAAYAELYEDNDGKQDIVSVESMLHDISVNYVFLEFCEEKYSTNDEARSLVIYNTPPCRKITVFDQSNPGNSPNDDFAIIETKQFIDRLVINTFEQSFENDQVRVTYFFGGNLDGKVSSIKVEKAACSGDLDVCESFETGTASFFQSTNDDIDWTPRSGSTPSSSTGPSSASHGTDYMYVEASGSNSPSKKASMYSGVYDLSTINSPELTFDYHMYGSNMGSLQIYAIEAASGDATLLFSKSGNQGNLWHSESISLIQFSNQDIYFEVRGTTGISYRSDMAIDIFCVKTAGSSGGGCNPANTVFSQCQGFENGLGIFNQVSGDNMDWLIRSGSTPSSSTGPSSAYSGSKYAYIESSYPNYPSKTGKLESDCFLLTGITTPNLQFRYHMYGSSMGSLKVNIINTDTGISTQHFSKTGNQGNAWYYASINLAAYVNQNIKILFVGTTSTSYRSDMAIDNICLN